MEIKERIRRWLGIDQIVTKQDFDYELTGAVRCNHDVRNILEEKIFRFLEDAYFGKKRHREFVSEVCNSEYKKLNSEVSQMVRKVESTMVEMERFIKSEAFIDDVVERIKRKQI
jgi:hypothetical protein